MAPKITAVRSVTLGVPDPAATARFYRDIWGLTPVIEAPGAVYLRGTGPYHHVLALTAHAKPEVLTLDLLASDRAAVDSLYGRLRDAASRAVAAPRNLDEPGGGYGFTVLDPEGRTLRILSDDLRHADTRPDPDRPSKITHVVLNSAATDATAKFYCDLLGFEVINRTKVMTFLKCNQDHHSLALAQGEASTLHHIAFAMQDVASVTRGAERMLAHGFPIGWGVGQHAAGEDVYAYFEAPDGNAIEYICKVPIGWDGRSSGIEHWDEAVRPTEKQAAAHRRVPFRPSGNRSSVAAPGENGT